MRVLNFLTLAVVAFSAVAVDNVNAEATEAQSETIAQAIVDSVIQESLVAPSNQTTLSVVGSGSTAEMSSKLTINKCNTCVKVLKTVGGKIISKGCGVIARIALGASCEVLGGGPEDPLADICAVAVIAGCAVIKAELQKHQDYNGICHKLSYKGHSLC